MSGSTWDPEGEAPNERFGVIRSMASQLVGRSQLANWSGFSFQGARNLFRALGYDRMITPRMHRWRYERGGIVGRLVESKPIATWRGGGEIVEDENPDTETTFEKEWNALNQRLNIWQAFEKADILAGLGRFSVLLIGGPGKTLTEPLERMSASQFAYLMPYSERDTTVASLETDTASARFGQPVLYSMSRLTAPLQGIAASMARQVHWTRIIHIADGLLDDKVFGQPRLERLWNLLDDLDKVVGGGAEAFWKRVDAGMQLKLDPNVADMKPADKEKLDEQLEEYTNGLRRILRTRGIDIETLTSSVAGMKDPITAIVSLLSAASAIPQRILLGSERGELASSQDSDEWSERISDRRSNFANTVCVRPLIDRLITLGAISEPKQYQARWPTKNTMNEAQLAEVAKTIALANQAQGETIVVVNEIREMCFDLPPIEDVQTEVVAPAPGNTNPQPEPVTAQRRAAKWAVLTVAEKRRYLDRVSAKRKEKPYKRIHAAADRFPTGRQEGNVASIR